MLQASPPISIDLERLPRHVAIIMDGNGRWAQNQNLPRLEGHRRGSERVEEIVEFCCELGVPHLTLYAFSQENWQRPRQEVEGLMDLLRYFLVQKRQKLLENGVRLLAIGQVEQLPEPVLRELTRSIAATRHAERMTLTLALSYSSRSEIVEAANLAIRLAMAGPNPAYCISEADFDRLLYTDGRPSPDLLIRTSGEHRMSNFLLWQMAYAELYFTDTLWPDFGREEFLKAVHEYQKRERRFGRIGGQLNQEAGV